MYRLKYEIKVSQVCVFIFAYGMFHFLDFILLSDISCTKLLQLQYLEIHIFFTLLLYVLSYEYIVATPAGLGQCVILTQQ